ncbi:glycosyltransferase [Pseudarthrobacter polychromogenes]|uniref:glycosyltransferase n=1 Tax=Pseudarthrobacter polychromogenes TaxID=1676 RepID=UPI001664090B|nr:hypothetical protein [Pseudarthrobacter polychromogenes]
MILATSSETFDAQEFDAHIGVLAEKLEFIDLGSLTLGRPGWDYQRKLLKQIDAVAVDYPTADIVVLEGDKLVVPLALHRKSYSRMTVLVMRAPAPGMSGFLSGLNNLLKRVGIAISRKRSVNIKVLAPAMRATPPYSFRGYPAVPDPVELTATSESIETYRSEMKLDRARVWVGVFGNITPRKNLDLVAEAIMKCGGKDFGLLVAGKIGNDERNRCDSSLQRLKKAGGAVVFDTRLLTDRELDSAIAAVDVVAIAHSSEGPSGILGKAAASGVSVAAAGALSLKEDIERLDAGAWSPLSSQAFAKALQQANSRSFVDSVELADGPAFASALLGSNMSVP